MKQSVCLVLLLCVFVTNRIPANAAVACTQEVRRGSLAATYVGAQILFEITKPGFGNNAGDCRTAGYSCEIYQCDVKQDSIHGCKNDAPLGHCIDVTVVQCIDNFVRQPPYISQIDFVVAGPCPEP